MRRSAAVLFFARLCLMLPLLGLLPAGCKSKMQYVKEGQSKSGASPAEGAADAVPKGTSSGSGSTVVGDDNFHAETAAPGAEVGSSDDQGADAGAGSDDDGGNPDAATEGATTGATSDAATTTGSGTTATTDPTSAGSTATGTTDPTTTTGGGTTDPTTTGGGTTDPTTSGATATGTTEPTTTSTTAAPTTTSPGNTGGGTTGTGSGPRQHPTHFLRVDWGDLVTFGWKLPGATSASLNIHSAIVPYDKTSALDPKKDLPRGILPLDTSTLEAGPYLITLTVTYPSFSEAYKLLLQIRPVLRLTAVDTAAAAHTNVAYPVYAETPAGADRVRLYMNDAATAFAVLSKLERGKHQTSAVPDRDGANLLKGSVIKNTVRGRPARLAIATGAAPPGPPPTSAPRSTTTNPATTCPLTTTPPTTHAPSQPTLPPPYPTMPTTTVPSPTHDPTPNGDTIIGTHLLNSFPGNCERLEIRGHVGSTDDASGAGCTGPANLFAVNDWYAAKAFNLPATVVGGTLHKNYAGPVLPKSFPTVDYAGLRTKVAGTLRSAATAASSWHPAVVPAVFVAPKIVGNVVVVGDAVHPFRIDGDVLVEGDLVIKGSFTGAGTIYATGNIFIPADIVAKNSAFPFSTTPSAAAAEGSARVASAKDALALVAGGAIFLGDNYPQYTNALTNPWVQAMYVWYPGGKPAYKRLYEPVWNCQTNTMPSFTQALYDNCDCHIHGGFSLIEASLYAWNGVYGASGAYTDADDYIPNSYAINGAVIARSVDIVSTPGQCMTPNQAHPTHHYPQGHSYLNFDWRLLHGVKEFSWLKPAYKGP